MAKTFASRTSASRYPGTEGQAMKRGVGVVASAVGPGGAQRSSERAGAGGVKADGGGDKGKGVTTRSTESNPHGLSASRQP